MDELIYTFLSNLNSFIVFGILCLTLFTVGKGADILVDNAVKLSLSWGVPKMVLGATLVSLGTTLPEASVSVLAAVQGNPDLALGNAIGSIIVDSGLILGIAALLGTLPIDKNLMKKQGAIQISSAFLLAIFALPFFSPGRTEGKIYQWMGFIFVGLLIGYMYASFKWAKQSAPIKELSDSEGDNKKNTRTLLQLGLMLLGIVIVIISSKLLIPSVGIVAFRCGIPESIIAATLVAFGTSVPELVTAIASVRKGHPEIAVGNIIGADILNVLFVLGVAAAVTPAGITVPPYFFYLQIPTMLLILILFNVFAAQKKRSLAWKQGLTLVLFYIAYLVLTFLLRGHIQ